MGAGLEEEYHMIDQTPCYAPSTVRVPRTQDGFYNTRILPVRQYCVHPPGTHDHSPIRNEMTALELVTANGSRWYGVTRGYINSELRMVIEGTNTRDAARMGWPVVPEELRA